MSRTTSALLLLSLLLLPSIGAVQVELRLVPHDRPDLTVDALEKSRPVLTPVSTESGVEFQKAGLDLVCWARNIRIDGELAFERYHQGKYVDRLPVVRKDLKPGIHTIWPGWRTFVVAEDGEVSADSEELQVEGNVVRIRCYPVTVRAYWANPSEGDLPMSMRVAPLPDLTVREAENALAEERSDGKQLLKTKEPLELLPVFDEFAPLTVWLPANSAGRGYMLHPVGLTFHLDATGVHAGAGGGNTVEGLTVDRYRVDIPLHGFPVHLQQGTSLAVAGVQKLSAGRQDGIEMTRWYPRREAYALQVSEDLPPIEVDGDLTRFPHKAFDVSIADSVHKTTRALAVELERRHLRPNETLLARVTATGPGTVAQASCFAKLAPHGTETWQDLSVAVEEVGRGIVSVPDVTDGVYTLRIGLNDPATPADPPHCDHLVTITRERNVGFGLFTQRGRDAFYRGESFWIGLGVVPTKGTLPAGSMFEITLARAGGELRTFWGETSVHPIEQRQTFVVRVPAATSLALAPGRYRLVARTGDLSSRPLDIDIVDPTPKTHFVNLMNGKYSSQGEHYRQVLRDGKCADELARSMVENGYNVFMGMTYDMSRVNRTGVEIEQLVRECPALGPWEAYYQPSGRDRLLNAAVRNNLPFYEEMFTYNDTTMPRGEKLLSACSRYVALEMASMRHSPAFKGMCVYDECYSVALNSDPMAIVDYGRHAEEMMYRERHPGMTSAKAMKALDRFTGRPAGQRSYEDLEKFRTWPTFEEYSWQLFIDRMVEAGRAVMPESRNFNLMRFGGGNGSNITTLGPATAPAIFQSLDIASCVMYKDGGYGDRPVFAPMQADVLRVRDDLPVWTQIHDFHGPGRRGDHLLRQAIFGLSQKIEGLSYFCLQLDPFAPHPSDQWDTVKDIADRLLTPYGDMFLELDKGYKKVAIYYSREADYLALRKPNKLTYACEGLWVACMRAGFPADFLYDHQVRAGKGGEYDVVFVPGIYYEDEVAPDILTALQKVTQAGKLLVVERGSKLPIENARRLDSDLDEYDDKQEGAFPRNVDFETIMVWDQSENTTRIVREFLGKHIPPAAEHSAIVGPDWLRRGEGEYLVIANFEYTGFTGLHKTLYQAPTITDLRFPKRPPACYDVLEMQSVQPETEGEWMTLHADMRHCPGKVYAFLPAEIAKVELRASAGSATGGVIDYTVSVRDAKGNVINAAFPIEVVCRDQDGERLLHAYRAAAPTFRGVCQIPANAAPGRWTVHVRELISGRFAESAVTVREGVPLPLATTDARDVRMVDPDRVRGFVESDRPLKIVLDSAQEWVAPQAERLRKSLSDRGRRVEVVRIEDVLRLPVDWDRDNPVLDGSRLWRGDLVRPGLFVDADVVVLGKRYENQLIEALIRRDALAEPLTKHFPGSGRSLVAWTHRAFSVEHDTVSILANDAEGLARGIDAVLAGGQDVESVAAHPTVIETKGAGGALVSAPEDDLSSAPTPLRNEITKEDAARCLDVDSATGRLLVGTSGYGHNLFCFSGGGDLLWKQFLPEHDVYLARWYDDGKRVVAATARGFQVLLLNGEDGTPLKRFASTEWPRFHYTEGAVSTEVQVAVNPALRQILVAGLTGVMAVDFDGRKMWSHDRTEEITRFDAERFSDAAPEFSINVSVGGFRVGPDGSKIAYWEYRIAGTTVVNTKLAPVWKFVPAILDARTGSVLAEWAGDPGMEIKPGGWRMTWPADSATPFVHHDGKVAALGLDGVTGEFSRDEVAPVDEIETDGWVRSLARSSEGGSRTYRMRRDGLLRCADSATGDVLWDRDLYHMSVLYPLPDGIMAGSVNGHVARLTVDGDVTWLANLHDQHDVPGRDYARYVDDALLAIPDVTNELYPPGEDAPGDFDGLLRMGLEQIENGGFEAEGSWASEFGVVGLADSAKSGERSLVVDPGGLVSQSLERKVIPSATYLLEFWLRAESVQTRLAAGVQETASDSRENLTVSSFGGRPGEWRFARLAVKTTARAEALTIGFEAEDGRVLVDDVSLRPVRFPSANLLANEELHAVEPTFVSDLRVQYDRVPSALKRKLMDANRVTAAIQGGTSTAKSFTEEEAFLHNGRLDDVGPRWRYPPTAFGFTVSFAKPAHVSHLVLYLNNATPGNVYRTISILANDMETRVPHNVALVRNNRRRFMVVRFPEPVYTDSLRIFPGRHPAHHECLTEVEAYGPLGGPEMVAGGKGFADDANAAPMFMGSPSHVPTTLSPDVVGTYRALPSHRWRPNVPPAFHCGATVAENVFTYGDARGAIVSCLLPDDPADEKANIVSGPRWRLATIAPTTTPARYARRLLVGSADGKLHAVADNGTYLWSFKTGGRVYSSPLPDGDEVYFGSDDGKLYKVDIDSGILIWEFETGGKIRSAPALADGLIVAVSWDGNVYAVNAASGKAVWKAPVAEYTRSSPAIGGAYVYVGDEEGRLHCLDAKIGKECWQANLGGYISMCPVVTPDGLFCASEQGHAALVGLGGQAVWQRDLGRRVTGQVVATQSQLLVPTEGGLIVLRRVDGEVDERFQAPGETKQIVSVVPYGTFLCLVECSAYSFPAQNRTFCNYDGKPLVWVSTGIGKRDGVPTD